MGFTVRPTILLVKGTSRKTMVCEALYNSKKLTMKEEGTLNRERKWARQEPKEERKLNI